ncbi:acyltransferase [Curtobacterium sp. MCLR17_058]|uniref:acyltransferase family protein n=1 Tax=Curtobacterium sp. MCLR17_058 TaxID=2175635 RepID=UPI000DA7C3B4|nr:acyltransferase [Curtobacterium sp. MCLR17_058]WIB44114.1 acyltransferase [Curtobacterium sp. MCLR17_058]
MVEMTPAPLLRERALPQTQRYAALDGLRFVAALAVLAFHYTARETDAWTTPASEFAPGVFDVSKYGVFGVDLFFVISGFVILMSAWGRPLDGFVASRIARLYPAYWVSVLLTAAVLIATGAYWLSPSEIAINLTMLHEPFGVDHVDGVYWTLWVEMRFYLLIAILLCFRLTERKVLVLSVVWPVVAVLAERHGFDFLAYMLVWQHAPLFAGGMLIYLLVRERRNVMAWMLLAVNIAFAITTAGPEAAQRIESTTGSPIPEWTQFVLIVMCFGAVLLVTLTPVRRLSWSWLTTVGALTYPLYLLHEHIGWKVIAHTQQYGWLVAVLLATIVSIALAAGVHYGIERPFAPKLRRAVQAAIGDARSHGRRAE